MVYDKLKFDSLLIITYGRSGSTLLQGVLNSIPGVLIRGENRNFTFALFDAFQRLVYAKGMGGESSQHPWFGASDLDPIKFANMLSGPIKEQLVGGYSDLVCYGFKEIRYGWTDENLPDFNQMQDFDIFEKYLYFLSLVFPNVGFVFNTRESNAVASSGWWQKKDVKWVFEHIKKIDSYFLRYTKENKENCFLIDYDDVSKQAKRLEDLFSFLGAEYSFQKISEVLSVKHSVDFGKIDAINVYPCKHRLFIENVEIVFIDRLPKPTSVSVLTFSGDIGGVILVKQGSPKIARVFLSVEGAELDAAINLDSPVIHDRFPLNPHSGKARFLFESVKLSKNKSINLSIKLIDGSVFPVSKIKT